MYIKNLQDTDVLLVIACRSCIKLPVATVFMAILEHTPSLEISENIMKR